MNEKAIRYTDETQPNGDVIRTYYRDGVSRATVRVDADASPQQRASALRLERYYLGSTPAPSAQARTTPAVESAPEPPKSLARQALERMYEACFAHGVRLDDADELAQEVGVESATGLILQHGSEAPMQALATAAWQNWGGPPA